MKLPNADQAIIEPEKLHTYLLSLAHPVGRFKAEFFRSMGFSSDNWLSLSDGFRAQLRNDAKIKEKTDYGQKFEIRGVLTGPSGKTGEIVTAWIVLTGEEIPRFITAYPGGQ